MAKAKSQEKKSVIASALDSLLHPNAEPAGEPNELEKQDAVGTAPAADIPSPAITEEKAESPKQGLGAHPKFAKFQKQKGSL